MQISNISFRGTENIKNLVNQYKPLTKDENKLALMAIDYHQAKVERTSDGDFVGSDVRKLHTKIHETLKSLALTPSPFAYKTAVDLINAPANDAIAYSRARFQQAAIKIAEKSPDVTKEMILEDFDKLNV